MEMIDNGMMDRGMGYERLVYQTVCNSCCFVQLTLLNGFFFYLLQDLGSCAHSFTLFSQILTPI